jgi:hypothetical protein
MSKFKVKLQIWVDGLFHQLEHEFESFEESLEFLKRAKCDTAKVFDELGRLIHFHSKNPHECHTYA